MSTTILPVADSAEVRRYVGDLARRHPRIIVGALLLHSAAAVAGLAAPRLLGDLVEEVKSGTTIGHVDTIAMLLAGFLVLQTVLTRYARYISQAFGEQVLEVRHCPGHTPGHVVFFHRPSRLAIVGDVLFRGSIGRTDFPRGDHATLVRSIRSRLWPLEDEVGGEVTFIPGHGPLSTFRAERADNPFVGDRVR